MCDGVDCKIVPLDDYYVVLGKQWINERKVGTDEKTYLVDFYSRCVLSTYSKPATTYSSSAIIHGRK